MMRSQNVLVQCKLVKRIVFVVWGAAQHAVIFNKLHLD